ncbi:hypothetical protein LINGRAHAP2_LOCUS23708 [Linum grandiflorum]
MFDYWKKKCLVQTRKLNEELAQAMQVVSSPEEWKFQGYKLLREGNYEMTTVCFERAKDEHGEKFAKAAGLRASADIMQSSNPEEASIARRQATDIFESIGKAEYAAECFYVLKDYEKVGMKWKQAISPNSEVKWSTELEKTEHGLLERAALRHHDLKDGIVMMRYVKAFDALESIRTFLRSLGYLDQLLPLEEEYG